MCKINGKKLEEARLNAGMTQRELAKESGVSQFSISSYENGKSNPSDESVERICMILKISKDDIEIKDIGYNFKNGESKIVSQMRKKKNFKRYSSPIETEAWIAKRRNEETEERDVMAALSSAISFGDMKKYIVIDPTYIHVPIWQRHTDMAKAEEICKNFKEEKFDPVKIFLKDKYECIGTDGLHRIVARIKRNEILKKEGKQPEKIVAEIINCTEMEAINIFRGQQAGRKTMTVGDMYRASIEAGDPDYVKFKEIFEENRIQISEELNEIPNAIGVIRPSSQILRLSSNKTEMLKQVLDLIKLLDWCGSTDKNAYTLRTIRTLMKLITVYGSEAKEKLLKKCRGAVYYESKVFPIKSNAELYDMLATEITK